jgi:hypothetical protein
MSTDKPQTCQQWLDHVEALFVARDGAAGDLERAQMALDAAQSAALAAQYDFEVWRNSAPQLLEEWKPALARLSDELGTAFEVVSVGGGCRAVSAKFGPVRMLITDYGDGDLSYPYAGTGWMIGFYLPDSPWTGATEWLAGDRDARGVQGLVKLVAHAVAAYVRGARCGDGAGEVSDIVYGPPGR